MVISLVRRIQHILKMLALAAILLSAQPTFGAEQTSEGKALFWTIWGVLSESAKSCKSETDARDFLDTAGMVVGDPGHSKVFSNVVETLAIENPTCFLSAANSLQPRALKTMIEYFLARPKQHSPKDIEQALAKYWEQGTYSKIQQVYLEARQ